jgi:hypothetical protein
MIEACDGDIEKARAEKLKAEKSVSHGQSSREHQILPVIQSLYNWFFNHSQGSTSGTGRKKIIDLSGKKKKKLQPFQIYSQLYCESKWKATLDEEYIQYKQTVGDGKIPKRHFIFAMERMRQIFTEESVEVKEEVEAYRKKLEEERSATANSGVKDALIGYQK